MEEKNKERRIDLKQVEFEKKELDSYYSFRALFRTLPTVVRGNSSLNS